MKNNILYKYALAGAFLLAPFAVHASANCEALPDCESIGFHYTADECGTLEKLKCPFNDNLYFCSLAAAPTSSCDSNLGLYETCPEGVLCPDGMKSNGCYMASRCFKAMGYLDEQPQNKTCETTSYTNYLGESKTCYSNCGCTTSEGYYGSKPLCDQNQLTTTHLACEKPSGSECFHSKAGYCSETACYENGACHEEEFCSASQHYTTATSRSVSGTVCRYRKRGDHGHVTITNGTAQYCVDQQNDDGGWDTYPNCSCASGYMYDTTAPRANCWCHKAKRLSVRVTPYAGSGTPCASDKEPYTVKITVLDGGSSSDISNLNVSVRFRRSTCTTQTETYNSLGENTVCVYSALNGNSGCTPDPLDASISFRANGVLFSSDGYQDISNQMEIQYYTDTVNANTYHDPVSR